jgi:signal peptidase I
MPQEKRENFFTELLKFALIAIVIVIPIRLFVAKPFIVSGASMKPTFDSGQYLIVDELSYRIGNPERGEVIIFRYPKDPSQYFIKRVIGLPGETVKIENGAVSVVTTKGQTLNLSEPYVTNRGNGADMTRSLGANEYFVMGDNRPESSDSRIWGNLPRSNIVGRALVRLLPLDTASIFPGSTSQQ